ncbi:hypothetical protein AQ490_08825 [Wenjunlia vitaminophila]|uniref:Uncharacterized protein n=1 Tax=Wenjunlia vitaminophila TaxID=76728 RepID=A0A0T6LLE0_WENVI|nr:DUF5682 family protein [Wenjunlia vitaminophila]KRV46874.1 hypothetical protein AQ490_08825 [Wenjunlia vitaminophila]
MAGTRASDRGELALLGVRHHGPGSARAVRAALEQFEPDVVLVEGPPEADGVLHLAADEQMRPPVALLAHVVDDPAKMAFWPVAEFSPEWVAIRHAQHRGVPVRFIDLPASHGLAMAAARAERELAERLAAEEEAARGETAEGQATPGSEQGGSTDRAGASADEGAAGDGGSERDGSGEDEVRVDPIRTLAEAAGYDDAERWWEDAVEHRVEQCDGDALAPFEALAEAMAALREEYGDGGHRNDPVREAHMRLRIREARREFDRVAVVCGAWHVPALTARTTVTADRQELKGLPKAKVEVTWVPWTHRRLGLSSGYGAGITSPGWYHHLFTAPDRPVTRWMTRVAGLLREEDFPVSSAHVIESVRLAESLAVMRGRPLAGLTEATDAVRAVMCDGSDVPLALVAERLVIGDDLGEVPDAAPAVPLQRDLTRTQRTLRLKPEALEKEYELDLREPTGLARSQLLHRLSLLRIGWGEPVRGRNNTGTFRETWRLRWEPELAVSVAEAGAWGTTVVAAATAKAEDQAVKATALAEVTALAERCLRAQLPDALPTVMRALSDLAALDADVGHLAQALPALVRSARYGDVRGTDAAALREVADGLAFRICVGLPPACLGLDQDGAQEMRQHLDGAHQAIGLLDNADLRRQWLGMLGSLARREAGTDTVPGVSGLLRGRAARLLMDDGELEATEAARLMGLALSPGTAPADAAAWVEGFLSGGGMLLVHDERLLGLIDTWLTGVSPEAFHDVLPLLRRTFAEFEPGVRRTVGELVRRGGAGRSATTAVVVGYSGFGEVPDTARADRVLPVVGLLLGASPRDRDRQAVRGGTR